MWLLSIDQKSFAMTNDRSGPNQQNWTRVRRTNSAPFLERKIRAYSFCFKLPACSIPSLRAICYLLFCYLSRAEGRRSVDPPGEHRYLPGYLSPDIKMPRLQVL